MTQATTKKVKLDDIIESLDAGFSANAENRLKQNGELGVLKTSSVVYGIFNPLEHKVINESDKERAILNPKSDCVLICRSNTIELVGQCAYVDRDYDDLYLPDTLWQIKPKYDVCSAKWLTYAVRSQNNWDS